MTGRVLAVMSGKGGVGKTTTAAFLAVHAAATGAKVLAVDTDPSAGLARDLGFGDRSDHGRGLHDALIDGQELQPLRGVRPNLDVVPAGEWTRSAFGTLALRSDKNGFEIFALRDALASLVPHYDLVVIDTPPYDKPTSLMVMAAATYLVLPSQADDHSIDGIAEALSTVQAARNVNPQLVVLGVVLIPFDSRAKKLRAETQHKLSSLLGENVKVFDATVRYSQTAATACRNLGLTAPEYALHVADEQKHRFRALRDRRRSDVPSLSGGVTGLADDFEALGREIFSVMSAYEKAA